MPAILLAEDDRMLNKLISTVLKKDGHTVFETFDGESALSVLEANHIDLVVSDIVMPKIDGYTLLKLLRETGHTIPVLFVTARGTFDDKCKGFNLGVDDYMVKPIDINELSLRVNALLRRSKIANEKKLVIGDTVLDSNAFTVTEDGETVTLPQKEFLLLFKLLSYPDRVFTRLELMDEIWGFDSESDEKTVNVHIRKLRSRYENSKDFSIETVRGLGYKAVLK